jgi:hypothetical protein
MAGRTGREQVIGLVVEVPAEEFLRTHRGLVNLLQTIQNHKDNDTLATNKLCIAAFGTRSKYCFRQLELAERLGYIKRKPVRRLKADGSMSKTAHIVNFLTPRGDALLAELKGNLGDL